MMGQEPRQTTSNVGHLHKPSIQALIHGLNRHYYSIAIDYRKNELEQAMLLNLHKKRWTDGLSLTKFDELSKRNEATITVIRERPSLCVCVCVVLAVLMIFRDNERSKC
jgi:26S proteasome regulatory subunit N11